MGLLDEALQIVKELMFDWYDMDYYLDIVRHISIQKCEFGICMLTIELMDEKVSTYDMYDFLLKFTEPNTSTRALKGLGVVFTYWKEHFPNTPLNISQFDVAEEMVA